MVSPLSFAETPDGASRDRMAESPRPVSAPFQGFSELRGMRKSTRYGILLYLLNHSKDWELSENQKLWIIYHSRKFSEAELLRAGGVSEKLASDDTFFQRMKKEVQETYFRVPRLNPQVLKEKRRIGIGYRDKGSLRPLHLKRLIGESAFWDEDIQFLLPLTYEVSGKWLTAEEVVGLSGANHLSLALAQIWKQTLDIPANLQSLYLTKWV